MTRYLSDASFFTSLDGLDFMSQHGANGVAVFTLINTFLAREDCIRPEKLATIGRLLSIDPKVVGDIVSTLLKIGVLSQLEDDSVFNPIIAEDKRNLEEKRRIYRENGKKGGSAKASPKDIPPIAKQPPEECESNCQAIAKPLLSKSKEQEHEHRTRIQNQNTEPEPRTQNPQPPPDVRAAVAASLASAESAAPPGDEFDERAELWLAKPTGSEPWERDPLWVSLQRRPLVREPSLFFTRSELAHQLRLSASLGLDNRDFRAMVERAKTLLAEKPLQAKNVPKWMLGFLLKEQIELRTAVNRKVKSEARA